MRNGRLLFFSYFIGKTKSKKYFSFKNGIIINDEEFAIVFGK